MINSSRSFLFVPADKKKMLNKIPSLDADVFILDLEDSVNPQNKEEARSNIRSVLPGLKKEGKSIMIRINEVGSLEAERDVATTLSAYVDGYIIPKFEDISVLERFIADLECLERNKKMAGNIPLILMVENPKGVLELRRLDFNHRDNNNILKRISGIALGGEDYLASLTSSRKISPQALDLAKDEIVIFCNAHGIISIGTVFPDFSDDEGLRYELAGEISRGFTSNFAIHPSQIGIINEMFYPDKNDIKKSDIILSRKNEIEEKGAISIDGVMYDAPHLKWAEKIRKYIDDIGGN